MPSSSWIQAVVSYVAANRRRIFPFLVVGGSAFIVNGGLFWLFRSAGLSGPYLIYLALALSIEVSILYNFSVQYLWTWRDTERVWGRGLLLKALTFHVSVAVVGALTRFPLFWLGQALRLHDFLNFVIGVAVATIFDFVLYDKVVFRRRLSPLPERAPGDRVTLRL